MAKATARTASAEVNGKTTKGYTVKDKTNAGETANAKQLIQEEAGSSDSSSTSDSEGEGEGRDVSRKGLERLMKALGQDGLSDMDMAHLEVVVGGDEDEDDEAAELSDDKEGELDDDDEDEDNDQSDGQEASDEDEAEDKKTQRRIAAPGDSLAASIARSGLVAPVDEEQDEEDDDDEDDDDEDGEAEDVAIPLESLSEAALDALPESVRARRMYREKVNDEEALRRICDDIALGGKGKPMAWIETLVVPYDKSIQEEVGTENADDDLKRELAFYKQALHTATQGKQLASQSSLPFSRPSDFFAEMVKSDEHMERVRQRILDERAGLKASEEARKQRELKKFGKKVQVEKHLERQRSKRDFEEKVKGLKRKRNGGLDGAEGDDDGADDFDVRLESAMAAESRGGRDQARSASRGGRDGRGGGPRMKRDVRDAKYGFGGKKRHAKENTRESTNDFGGTSRGGKASRGRGGFGGGAKRGTSKRPGKTRRASGRG